MPDAQLFPDSIELGERRPNGDACVSPAAAVASLIGLRRKFGP